jgi:hypothetical protein
MLKVQLLEVVRRPVGRAIVDEDDLERWPAVLKDAVHATLGQSSLIAARDDDAGQRIGQWWHGHDSRVELSQSSKKWENRIDVGVDCPVESRGIVLCPQFS